MKKLILFNLLYLVIGISTFSQESNDTNKVNINGTIYYYLQSTTPSSPIPDLEGATTIDTGNWYGKDAVMAWVAMMEWIIENSTDSNRPVLPRPGEKVFITSVHSYKGNTPESRRYAIGATMNFGMPSRDGITIYYWIVSEGESIENGEKAYRSFALSNW